MITVGLFIPVSSEILNKLSKLFIRSFRANCGFKSKFSLEELNFSKYNLRVEPLVPVPDKRNITLALFSRIILNP